MSDLSQLKVAAIQMVSSANREENLANAAKLLSSARQSGAQLAVLPEYFSFMGLRDADKLPLVEPHLTGSVQSFLSNQAKSLGLWLIGGTLPIASDQPQRPYPRCYVYNPDGEVVCWYDKIHLFDVQVNDTQKRYQESRYSLAGKQVVSFDTPWGRVGLAVCYDLRFPEMFRQLIDQQVNVIVVPAAFTRQTGRAHWTLLLKARAVENLCYVVASAQGGRHQNGRETWGHSSIISPWGELVDSLEFDPGLVCATLDLTEQQKLRREFPVLNHRRV